MVPGGRCWWTPCGFAPFPDAACAGWFDGAKLHGPGGGRLDELALGVFVAEIPNRNSPPAKIAALRSALKGESPAVSPAGSFDITRSRPHGHCAAVLATIHRMGLAGLLDSAGRRHRRAALALIVSRIFEPDFSNSPFTAPCAETGHSTLGESLDLEHA